MFDWFANYRDGDKALCRMLRRRYYRNVFIKICIDKGLDEHLLFPNRGVQTLPSGAGVQYHFSAKISLELWSISLLRGILLTFGWIGGNWNCATLP